MHPISFTPPKRYQDSQWSGQRKPRLDWAWLTACGAKTSQLHSFHLVLCSPRSDAAYPRVAAHHASVASFTLAALLADW